MIDVAIVGAGIVGLATAREITARHRGLTIAVLDKEPGVARHQSGRNSGVLHSGIYYAPGSLKARLCVDGAQRLAEYCSERGIEVRRCGKLVVAVSDAERGRLHELHRRGLANGARGLELVGPQRIRELEPHVAGVEGLLVPGTGIVDYGLVAAAYADDVVAAGGSLLLGAEVTGIVEYRDQIVLQTTAGEVQARHVVGCAGVYSDRLARLQGADRDPQIVPFRGDYLVLRPESRYLADRRLIYPVPDPSFPFLGIHSTLRPDGDVWLGPNAVLALGREGYRRRDFELGDLAETFRSDGFRRLARRHWKTGGAEVVRDLSPHLFVRQARRLLPGLSVEDVRPGPSGIRAQALAADGSLVDDFVLEARGRAVHVRNAPSPGATSSLAIAGVIVDMLEETFAW